MNPVGTFKNYKKLKNFPAREFYSPILYTCLRAYRRMNNYDNLSMTNSLHHLINAPWDNDEKYIEAVKWLEKTGSGKVHKSYGTCYINGFIYYNVFAFETVEDKLAFMLKFPELV